MSEWNLHRFVGAGGSCETAVALPFELGAMLDAWSGLRGAMAREIPDAFQRDEWAYLIQFLERDNLAATFRDAFGERADTRGGALERAVLARPGGPVAVWLPNNVSLLGPLVIVLLGLTGNPLWLKGGTDSEDLGGAFLDFVRARATGALAAHLESSVRFERFGRDDPRNHELARGARTRVIFGSDAAAVAIDALEHPVESRSFSFVDRRSEAWVDPARLDDALLASLAKVFAIYGQAGCTSPRRVVLLDATPEDAVRARDRLLALWPDTLPGRVAPHTASANLMARQWAAGLGWDAALAGEHAAVLLTEAEGTSPGVPEDAPMTLPIVARSMTDALSELPDNVQTIGHAVGGIDDAWLARLAGTGVKRFVPLARMHHFGPLWDGSEFWRETFEFVEVTR